jgi:hypothetical protein
MTTAKVLVATALVFAGSSIIAQQATPPPDQPGSAPSAAAQPNSAPPTPTAAPVEMSPVSGELVDKLDSKTAKAGDSIAIKTQSTVKTADGTEIPKGSKLVGHVTGVKASGQGNENSQVALQFDRAELKGGQTMAIRSELQSLSPAGSEIAQDTSANAPSSQGAPKTAAPGAPGGGAGGSQAGASGTSPGTTQPENGTSAPTVGPVAGTVVARTGNIAIRTTSIPGVLLASNEPGQQDPRMANSSGILLGAKRDIQLDQGTKVVIGVASTAGGSGPQ